MRSTKLESLFLGNLLNTETLELSHILNAYNRGPNFESGRTQILDIHGQDVVFPTKSRSSDDLDPNGATVNYY